MGWALCEPARASSNFAELPIEDIPFGAWKPGLLERYAALESGPLSTSKAATNGTSTA